VIHICPIFFFRNFNTLEERSFEEWTSILDLSTRWGFTSIRDLAIRCLKPPSPLRRLILARRYVIEGWVDPALLELCERPEPLSLDEARQMDFEDVVLLGSVRQDVRSATLRTNGAGIRDCIQAWRNGEPWSPGPADLSRPPTPGTPVASRPPTPTGRLAPAAPLAGARCSTPKITVASQPATPSTSVRRPKDSTPHAFGDLCGTTDPSSSGPMGRAKPSARVREGFVTDSCDNPYLSKKRGPSSKPSLFRVDP